MKSRPPVVLQFSWNWFTNFISKLCMLLRGHFKVCVTVLDIFWKNLHQVKMIKNGRNGTETEFLDILGKSTFNIQQKLHVWQKSGSQVIAKNALSQLDLSIL